MRIDVIQPIFCGQLPRYSALKNNAIYLTRRSSLHGVSAYVRFAYTFDSWRGVAKEFRGSPDLESKDESFSRKHENNFAEYVDTLCHNVMMLHLLVMCQCLSKTVYICLLYTSDAADE